MSTLLRAFSLLCLALLPLTSTGAEKTPWYQVEVIVFAKRNAPVNSEVWPLEAVPAPGARELSAWRGYTGPDSTPFQRLPASSLQLGKEYERLKAAPDLEPLLHTGWLQPGLAREESVAIRLKSEPGLAGWMEGTLRLVLSRYLHLETNLIYHHPGETAEGVYPVIQLIESRRMRSRELHYLDHPMLGVIAVVTPVEAAAKPAAR